MIFLYCDTIDKIISMNMYIICQLYQIIYDIIKVSSMNTKKTYKCYMIYVYLNDI